MSSAQVVHPDEQAHERAVPGPEPSTELRSDLKADERSDPCALAAAVLRAHVEADLAADACGDDSDVRHPCREINARACCRRVGSAARETLKIATATRK